MSKNHFQEKHFNLLLIEEKGKRYYVIIKDFNTFIYNHTLHRGSKQFCRYYLQAFSTEKYQKAMLINVSKLMVNKTL